MQFKKDLVQTINLKDYPPLVIKNIQGYLCGVCKEGLINISECRHMDHLVGEHKAKTDSQRIVAAELADMAEARELIGVSRQRLHQMMHEGKIPYVYINHSRIPIRKGLKKFRSSRNQKHAA